MDDKITRRSFGQILGGVALGGSGLVRTALTEPSGAQAAGSGTVVFPFGTHVYREPHLPLDQLRSDFTLLRRLGFTMIKIQESWSMDEQREGEINLATVAQVISDARQNGLLVYFGVTMEQAPAWLWKKYPDASMVYETGQPYNDPTQYLFPNDAKPGPCWHHPGAREAGSRFVEGVGREIGKYDNILVWNVWQEIGFGNMRPGHMGLCYCANTLREFRIWLQEKYGTLAALNRVWLSGYADWDEIEPPRMFTMLPPFIDFRYFMDDVYLSFALRWKAEAFRRSDPLHRRILAHMSHPTIGRTAEWRYAEQLDVIGSSCYPAWTGFEKWDADRPAAGKPAPRVASLHHELWENVLMKYDYMRGASRDGEFWTAELQGGPISMGQDLGRVPDAGDLRRWVLGCLAAGVRGLCFWNHRLEPMWQEQYGFGLLDGQGEHTPRADEASRLANAIAVQAELFARGSVPQADVAMVMNEDLWHFAEGSGFDVGTHLQYTIRGIYKALWDEGIPLDFIEADKIATVGKKYRVLIQPFALALSEAVIEAYQSYVRGGRVLICEATPGRLGKYGYGFATEMGPDVSELFGAVHKQVVSVREPRDGAKWSRGDRTYGDSEEYADLVGIGEVTGLSVAPAYHVQTLTLTTGKALLKSREDVAGCVNKFGEGRAYLIGSLLGHALLAYGDKRNGAFLSHLLAHAGVRPDRVGRLQRRRRVLGRKEAWFLFNTTGGPVEEVVALDHSKTATDLLGAELPPAPGGVRVKVAPLDVRCLVLEG
jgi:beta-galactosidase